MSYICHLSPSLTMCKFYTPSQDTWDPGGLFLNWCQHSNSDSKRLEWQSYFIFKPGSECGVRSKNKSICCCSVWGTCLLSGRWLGVCYFFPSLFPCVFPFLLSLCFLSSPHIPSHLLISVDIFWCHVWGLAGLFFFERCQVTMQKDLSLWAMGRWFRPPPPLR